jgi:hypothetical protein
VDREKGICFQKSATDIVMGNWCVIFVIGVLCSVTGVQHSVNCVLCSVIGVLCLMTGVLCSEKISLTVTL